MDVIFDCACAGISVMDGICDFASLLQATTNEMHEIEAITAHEEPSSTPRSGRNRKCCPHTRHQLRRNRNRCPPSGREHRPNRNCCPQQYPNKKAGFENGRARPVLAAYAQRCLSMHVLSYRPTHLLSTQHHPTMQYPPHLRIPKIRQGGRCPTPTPPARQRARPACCTVPKQPVPSPR